MKTRKVKLHLDVINIKEIADDILEVSNNKMSYFEACQIATQVMIVDQISNGRVELRRLVRRIEFLRDSLERIEEKSSNNIQQIKQELSKVGLPVGLRR